MSFAKLIFFFLIATLAVSTATAQTRITRPIHFIVPYVPGGGTDLLSRLLAPAITEEFGQQVVVENRAGAGSTIGTLAVAKAATDGHTIGMIDSAFITNPCLMAKLPYDTLKDFTPVVFVATAPRVLVVHPSVPAANLSAVDAISLNGIVAPAGTPADYINRLNSAVQRALETEPVQKRLAEMGFRASGGTPAEFDAYIQREVVKWAALIKSAGIRTE
jgi:tripartite-type tricarboxylate transporter receptor subunit TctC